MQDQCQVCYKGVPCLYVVVPLFGTCKRLRDYIIFVVIFKIFLMFYWQLFDSKTCYCQYSAKSYR